VAHLYFFQRTDQRKKNPKEPPSQRTKTLQNMDRTTTTDRRPACNSGFAKKRVQWLIEHSTSHQILWYVDSFVLRNPPLRQAPKRYRAFK
jgi:hypothetical protein